MKIAGVDYPAPLLNALRDGRLVVFAGAGVSMGPPAGLPGFRQLAEQVAEGTGQPIEDSETVDRFLGRLTDLGTDVHQRSAKILHRDNPQPTKLHLNLIRLFSKLEIVRVVTTNFDSLFESATLGQSDSQPKVFQAPALPVGSRFHGIVHLHGSVNEPEEMVLTHRDFGRAYLTESDGWARRFLIDLFTNYTVLFVGYSHSDTIMTYLTPSLPPDGDHKRFALVGDRSDDANNWRMMGIEPVTFEQARTNDFSGLDAAVAGLAEFFQRGVLDWQREITNIANGHPPIDDESAGIVEHALNDPITTRFFTESAKSPEWVEWLDQRGYLAGLFTYGELDEQQQNLARWLVSSFAITHDSTLFALIERHGRQLSKMLWWELCRQLQQSISQSPDTRVITRWVLFLASVIPTDADYHTLSWLAKACDSVHATDSLLRVYEAMMKRLNQVPPDSGWHNFDMFHHYTKKALSDYIKPNLPEMSESLLALVTTQLQERYAILTAWEDDYATVFSDNFRRSAIEPHQQDEISGQIDPLIDTARECLEWLAAEIPQQAGYWCDRYVNSDAPLLRRLAIHAFAARNDISADDKIAWILERCDVNEIDAHHEIFRAVAHEYPQSSPPYRMALIQAISKYRAPKSERHDSDELSVEHHFSWFHWLHKADTDCDIAKDALNDVRAQRPEFVSSDHPGFTHWIQSGAVTSPWTTDTLLEKPVNEVLPDLLTYEPDNQQRFDGHDRWAMLNAVKQTAEAHPSWGLDLADALVAIGAWNSDLWQQVLTAWTVANLVHSGVKRVLFHLSADELHRRHARQIVDVLSELVRKSGQSEVTELLGTANLIAIALRSYSTADELPQITSSVGGVPQYVSWLTQSINHASGKLALFWIHSIVLWRRQQESIPQSLSDEYREALDGIIEEVGMAGKFGRTVLASNFHFFLAVDENWASNNLQPLFDTEHEDFQSAWDGFLTWGRLSPSSAELLHEKFVAAIPRVVHEFSNQMRMRFVGFYVGALGLLISSVRDDWISEFFKHADAGMRNQFALEVGHNLRMLDATGQQEWWNTWLKDYWENRLQGVPRQLDDSEMARMLAWVIHLPAVFPEAVRVAVQMTPTSSIDRAHILRTLGENELIDRYPDDLAKLLIHLGQYDTAPWFWGGTREVVDKLLAKDLGAELNQGLRELIVRHQFS